MEETHVYEVVGEVLFRRSGNAVRHIERCKVVRTRCIAYLQEGGGATANISVLVTGYDPVRFAKWFSDWSQKDNMGDDCQSGRPIDVAVPVAAFEQMLATGRPLPEASSIAAGRRMVHSVLAPGSMSDEMSRELRSRGTSFHPTIAAVLIDGRWEEPLFGQ